VRRGVCLYAALWWDMQGCGAVLFLGRGRWGRKKHRVGETVTRRCEERCSGGDELGRHVEAVVALIGVLFAGDEGGVRRYRSRRGGACRMELRWRG
jgi:hypothetical protein